MDDESAKAKFDKKTRVLSVYLPILRTGERAVEEVRLTQARRDAEEFGGEVV